MSPQSHPLPPGPLAPAESTFSFGETRKCVATEHHRRRRGKPQGHETDPSANTESISQTFYASSYSVPQAIQACADYAVSTLDNYAFQLYFLGSEDHWVCRTYYDSGPGSDASYFNIPNDDVLVAYGYQPS